MADLDSLICASGELSDGGLAVGFAVLFDQRRRQAFAIRFNGQPFVYLNECGHKPLPLDWEPGKIFDQNGEYLLCATHGARYEPDTGRCVGGPCNGKGLRPLAIQEHGGYVYLIEPDMKLATSE